MKRQGGFTLIELVVVIVILGILAVTAAPKFLNLQSDARASSLQGLKGAMAGAAGIVYGKAAIEGVERKSSTDMGADKVDDITTHFGYPTADAAGIGAAVVGLNDDWSIVSGSTPTPTGTIEYTFKSGANENCKVSYSASVSGAAPVISAAVAANC
ncbi:prepilin-type N-terminal cleavage/methylation domain-containing protein [Aliivibrio finisterrensis]|uniref:type II secretion system protein n=1 Tax=Aliivibrio finisterrensis TaxID=511998 RepID=UPI0010210E0D|nr:prepilin-type N-terminal cleavage/methylation domain-containing protein [Aliivibrio finisterrensis]RYU69155.1 prepilin-type N-terminal cleavage/methylation domain-containing protein [Aliivibrio finisterrensis]RYU72573.1 prepilin-type N-terminal cleavage/methylation domain-containing protein [Aliivibrio finisterrensis]RYU76001.1 prepilin-type N-terminal cleavage/methylation domain-containing protein [Aliivibrio finisterrensis]